MEHLQSGRNGRGRTQIGRRRKGLRSRNRGLRLVREWTNEEWSGSGKSDEALKLLASWTAAPNDETATADHQAPR